MIVTLEIPDYEVLTMTKMPNIGQILDKTYKNSRSAMIREIAHDRQVFISFNMWFLMQDEEQRELTMKNIKSTIPIDEIVPESVQNRELVVEAIKRVRANMELTSKEDKENI